MFLMCRLCSLFHLIATLLPEIYTLSLHDALPISSCAAPDTQHHIVISTREQKLVLLDRSNVMAIYPVSTSKFGLGDWRGRDRKSTRLNSSHRCNSYAVFCLKTKSVT